MYTGESITMQEEGSWGNGIMSPERGVLDILAARVILTPFMSDVIIFASAKRASPVGLPGHPLRHELQPSYASTESTTDCVESQARVDFRTSHRFPERTYTATGPNTKSDKCRGMSFARLDEYKPFRDRSGACSAYESMELGKHVRALNAAAAAGPKHRFHGGSSLNISGPCSIYGCPGGTRELYMFHAEQAHTASCADCRKNSFQGD
ncbi:hypothetical protein EGW08_002209 [Elysia chlorotica]|uniref:Uncharacterized protein n=1 Tax=Elysia chlorotica TaxID=188477 RepID=A0A433U890_ELYCH|nr:hypothetical protein EGW08_002209 [Elysia chlorotica]